MTQPKFGDYVSYQIKGHPGDRGPEPAYVIGETPYSDDGSHPVIAMEAWDGMPLHVSHCTVMSSGHDEICKRLRDRFEKKYPKHLKPLQRDSARLDRT